MKKILYTSAKNDEGILVLAKNAEKGNNYVCAFCDSEMILRKSGKTGKGSKRPHFAHKTLTPNCTPESALHYSFKYLVRDYINKNIHSSSPIDFEWYCKYCGNLHTGNIIKKAKIAIEEYNLKVCQPDIAILNNKDEVYTVIEIVVTHKPERKVIQFYKNENIILIQINLKHDDDLYNFKDKLTNPDIVDFCTNPKCEKCGSYLSNKYMTVIEGDCYRCKKKMKVASINTSDGRLRNLRPSDFTIEEVNIAKSKGVSLVKNYSKTMRTSYIANTCPSCRAFAGDHYIFTDYIAPAGFGELPSEDFNIGYFCKKCDKRGLY